MLLFRSVRSPAEWPCRFDRLKKVRCVENRKRKELRARQTHRRGGGKPAARSASFRILAREPDTIVARAICRRDFDFYKSVGRKRRQRRRPLPRNARLDYREKPRAIMSLPNYPHKLTKAAEPWLGGGAAFGRLQLHARVTSAAVRSCHFVLVAAAVVPLSRPGVEGGFCSLE